MNDIIARNPYANRFYNFFNRYKWWLLACYIYVVSWSLFYLPHVEITNSPEAFFPEDSPIVERFHQFKKEYQGRDFLIILYESEDSVLKPAARKRSLEIGKKLQKLSSTQYVISLDTLSIPLSDEILKEFFPPWFSSLFGKISQLFPQNLSQKQAEEVLDSVPFLEGFLICKDRKAGIIYAFLKEVPPSEQKHLHELIIPQVESILAREKDFKFYYFGTPRVHYELMKNVKKDETFFVPAATSIFILVLAFIFRSFICTALPLTIVAVALGILLGFMGYHGIPITTLTALLPPLILVIGVANVIHILTCYSQKRQEKVENPIHETFLEMWSPCFWTTFTTMIGFGSLVVSKIIPIREFGLLTAIGCLMCFVFSISSIVLIFPLMDKFKSPRKNTLQRWISFNIFLVTHYPKIICSAFLVIIFISLWSMSLIKVESNFIRYFSSKSSIHKDAHYIQNRLGSVGSLEILVSPKKKLSLVKQFRLLEKLNAEIKTFEHYGGSISIIEPLAAISKGLYGTYGLPEEEEKLLKLLTLFQKGEENLGMERLYLPDFKQFRITYRLPLLSSSKCTNFVKHLETTLNQKYGKELRIEVTGATQAYLAIAEQIVSQQIINFSIAFIFITLALTCIFQSLKTALFAMVPNIFPIVFTFGIMGLFGIELNTSTVMVASVSIGIAVDDTIHFICRFKEEFLKHKDYLTAVVNTIKTAGPAMTATSIILSTGFAIVCFGSFVPTQHFGFLVVITIVSALLADLLFLASLILLFQPKFIQESLKTP